MFETNRPRRLLAVAACAGTMLLVAGCASAPPAPSASLTEAKMAIQAAEKDEARQYAGAELDEARQKLIRADQAVVAEDMVLADRFAQESIVTANLASARSESAKAESINEEMRRSAKALAEEMRRAGDQQ
jgi:putative cell wall-binding protein